jgi:hypothetical protein
MRFLHRKISLFMIHLSGDHRGKVTVRTVSPINYKFGIMHNHEFI